MAYAHIACSPNHHSHTWTTTPGNLNLENVHLCSTIQQIDELAQDVQMQPPFVEGLTCIVVDTNILLHYLDVVQRFAEDAEHHSFPALIVVPGVVIYELDAQKNRDGLAWLARRASAWLLKQIKEKMIVKSQANDETCKSTRNWKVRVPGEVSEASDSSVTINEGS